MTREPVILPFADEHLGPAARLLAARQERLRVVEPGFPLRWCDPTQSASLVGAARATPGATGMVALEGDRVVGYLIGAVKIEGHFGGAAWVELAGHAVEEGREDVARDLFGAWSTPLVRERQVYRFLVNVPSVEPGALEAWYQVGFGQMHAYGLRATDASDLPPVDGVAVRDATVADAALMEATSELIWREQLGGPSWSPITPDAVAALRRDYVEELTEQGDRVWVAEDAASGEALGVSISYRLEPDLDVPDDNMKLASTTTFPAARRRGVARALVRAVLDSAAGSGAAWCVTDWRTSSLRASRTWTALGFRRTRVRLERRIDPAIATSPFPD